MKYIDTIEIKNFKSIRHQRIEGCKRINLFIGYPNVGKSNILEALGMFSLLFNDENGFELNDLCRLQHLSELFFNQDYKEPIEIFQNEKLRFTGTISGAGFLNVLLSRLQPDQSDFKWFNFADLKVNPTGSLSNRHSINHPIFELYGCGVKKYSFKGNGVINQRGPRYLGIPFGSNFLEVLLGSATIRAEVKELFDFYNLRLVIERSEQAIKFYKELSDGTAVTIPYHQIADTLKRLIFYKAAIETNEDTALIFEEPEAHMFPPYIKKFTSDVIYDKGRNQFFIATHSPYVLDAFAEDAFEDTSIYLVDYVDGETVIYRLEGKDLDEIRQYGVDLFYNLESYLQKRKEKYGKVDNH